LCTVNTLAFTYLGDALKKRVVPLAEKLNSKATFSCDVEKKEDVIKLFEDVKSLWGEIDFVVHAIAFSDKSELSGEYLNTTRENFLRSMLISCFSFTEVAREAAKIIGGGGGGRHESNQAGGKEASKLNEALASIPNLISKSLDK